MSTTASPDAEARPRQVTISGMLTVFGSSIVTIELIQTMSQLNSEAASKEIPRIIDNLSTIGIEPSVEHAREIARYGIMVAAVLSVTSLVLGYFVLRRDRGARIALTGLGGFVAVMLAFPLFLIIDLTGWLLAGYIVTAVWLLWTSPARVWFRDPNAPPPPAAGPPNGHRPEQAAGPPMPTPGPLQPPGWTPPPTGWPPPPGWQPPPVGGQPPPLPPGWRPPPGWVPPSRPPGQQPPAGPPPSDQPPAGQQPPQPPPPPPPPPRR